MDQRVANWRQRGEHVVADEQLASLAHPILAEGGLHAVHDGSVHAHAEVAVMLAVLRVAQPGVDEAMAADKGFAAVDHHQLAVVTVDTLVGALIFGFAVCTKPDPGPSAVAARTGPDVPPGWSYNPSEWTQRLPIIVLAIVGLYVSRYLAAYQLGYIPGVWDPFFAASSPLDPRNGTEDIITSWV